MPGIEIKGRQDLIFAHEEEIEVVTWMTSCQIQPPHIDIIRALFKWGDFISLFLPGPAETYRDNGLPGITAKSCERKPRATDHLLRPGTSIVEHVPLLQLLTVWVAFLPPDRITLVLLKTLSRLGDLHFGHFIFIPPPSFLRFKSSKTSPHFRHLNSYMGITFLLSGIHMNLYRFLSSLRKTDTKA